MSNKKKQIMVVAILAASILIAKNTETQRYQKVEDKGIVIDRKLGLIWEDSMAAKSSSKDWDGAKKYCQDLTLAGKDDWRLPNYDELIGIVNYKKQIPVISSAFKNVSPTYYWSSEIVHSNNSLAWTINLKYGNSHYYPQTRKDSVRCVRGG